MAGIVGGEGLGLFNGSLTQLNGFGGSGRPRVGSGSDGAYVNVVNGNLVIQGRDDYVAATGADWAWTRTYNSRGVLADDVGGVADNWLMAHQRRLVVISSGLSINGLERINEDGHRSVFTGSLVLASMKSTSGSGSHDAIASSTAGLLLSGTKFTYTEGSTGIVETYDYTGRLESIRDRDGNVWTFTYTGSLLTSVATTQAGKSSTTFLDYNAGTSELSQLRVVSDGVTTTRVRYGYTAGRLTDIKVDLASITDAVQDPNASVYHTQYGYDASGRVNRVTQGWLAAATPESELLIEYQGDGRVSALKTWMGGTTYRTQTFVYDDANRRTDVTDPVGTKVSYYYDTVGQLTSIETRNASNVLQSVQGYVYDASGNITQTSTRVVAGTPASDRIVRHTYDANGNLTLSQDALGNTVARTYNAQHQMLTEVRYLTPDANLTNATNEATNPLTTYYAYDAEQHLRFVQSAEGRVTEYVYDAAGNRTRSILYTGVERDGATAFDELAFQLWAGNVTDKTRRDVTDYAYDFRGQLTTSTRYTQINTDGTPVAASASVTRYIYNAAGELLQVIDPRGTAGAIPGQNFVTSYTYDGLGRVLNTTDSTGRVTTNTYDALNNRVVTALDHDLTTTRTYSKAGELIAEAHNLKSVPATSLGLTQYAYDAAGRLRTTTDPTGALTHCFYDARGWKIAEVNPEGEVTAWVYNDAGQVIRTTEYATRLNATQLATLVSGGVPTNVPFLQPTASALSDRVTHSVYDLAGRLAYRVVDDSADVDGSGVTVFRRSVTELSYDGANRVVQEKAYATRMAGTADPTLAALDAWRSANPSTLDRTTRSLYDADGLQIGVLDAAGYLTENLYDPGGRLIKTVRYDDPAAAGTGNNIATYRPAADALNDQTTHVLYNARSEVIARIDAEGYLTEYAYDLTGNLTTERRYNGKVSIPVSDNVATLIAQATAATPTGEVRSRTTTRSYDALNRLTQQVDSVVASNGASTDLTTKVWTYDPDSGFLIKTVTAAGTATTDARGVRNDYDPLGRLTRTMEGVGSKAFDDATTDAARTNAWNTYATKHTYDLAGRRIKSIDPNGFATFYYYDRDSRLRFMVREAERVDATTRKGELTEYAYNAFGELSAVAQYAQRIQTTASSSPALAALTGGLSTAADLVSRLTAAVLNHASNRVTQTSYTQRGQIDVTTDALLFKIDSNYDAFGQIAKRVSDVGATAGSFKRTDTFEYDVRGLLKKRIEDVGAGKINRTWEGMQYDAFGRLTQSKDANGNLWTNQYDRLGRTVKVQDPLGGMRSTEYDAWSRTLITTDAAGIRTRFTYNDALREITTTTDEGVVTRVRNNAHGQQVSVTVPNNGIDEVTAYGYDKDGRLTEVILPHQQGTPEKTVNTYDNADNLITVVDARGITTTYTYDLANRVLTRTVDPGAGKLNLVTRYAYNAFGETVVVTDPNGDTTETVFDKKGQVSFVVVDTTGMDATRLATRFSYDARGLKLSVHEGLTPVRNPDGTWNFANSAPLKITDYTYDNVGARKLEYTESSSDVYISVNHFYDKAGNLTRKIDSNGQTWRYAYDDNGRQIFSIDPLGGLTETIYDGEQRIVKTIQYAQLISLSNVETVNDAEADAWRPRITSGVGGMTADSNNRVTIYVRDGDGRVLYEIDAIGAVTQYEYDDANRIVDTVRYARVPSLTGLPTVPSPDQIRMRLEVVYNPTIPSEAVDTRHARSVYDAAGRALFQIDALNHVTENVYDANGNVVRTIRYPNALDTGTPLTVAGITAQKTSLAGTLGQARVETFVYDAANRLRFRIDGVGAVTETRYDAAGRVVDTIRYATVLTAYASATPPAPPALSAFVPPPVSLTQDQSTKNFYDGAGRLIQTTDAEGGTELYGYDVKNSSGQVTGSYTDKRTSFTNKLNNTWNYIYDGAGRLVEEIAPQIDVFIPGAAADFVNPEASLDGAILWAQGFDQNLSGLSSNAGAVLNTAGSHVYFTSNGTLQGHRTYTTATLLFDEYVVFRSEIQAASTSATHNLSIGATSSVNANRMQARVVDGQLFADYGTGQSEFLGTLDLGTRYIVEVMSGPGSSHVFVYKQGQIREEGFVYHWAGRVDDPRFQATGGGGTSGPRIANIIEYKGRGAFSGNSNVRGLRGIYYDGLDFTGTTAIRTDATVDFNWGTAAPIAGIAADTFSVHWTGGLEVERSGFYTFHVAGDDGYALYVDNQRVVTLWRDQERTESSGGLELEAGRRYKISMIYYDNTRDANVTLSWEGPGVTKQVISANNLYQSAYRDGYLEPVKVSDSPTASRLSLRTQIAYDALGNVIRRTEAAGTAQQRATHYRYDALGRQIETLHPNVGVYDATQDVNGDKRTRTESTTALTSGVTYDALGAAVASRDVGGNNAFKAYDAFQRLRYEVDANRFVTEYRYNAFGDQTHIIRYANRVTLAAKPAYSLQEIQAAVGLIASSSDRTIVTAYDGRGLAVEVKQPSVYVFDSAAPSGQQFFTANPTTTKTYNAFGDVVRESSLRNAMTDDWVDAYRYYDRTGRAIATIDPGGYLTEWTYELNGATVRTTEYATPVTGTFDAVTYTRPSSSTGQGITASVLTPETSPSTTFTGAPAPLDSPYRAHNAAALTLQKANPDRQSVSRHDRLGRMVEQTLVGVDQYSVTESSDQSLAFIHSKADLTTRTTYDRLGNVVGVTDAQGGTSYAYFDALGRLTAVIEPQRASGIESYSRRDRPLNTYLRDFYGNVVRETKSKLGALSATFTTYAHSGASPDDQSIDRQYDILGRLVREIDAEGHSTSFSYDVFGNMRKAWTPFTDADGVERLQATIDTYDAVGQSISQRKLDSAAGTISAVTTQMRYDAFGQITEKGVLTAGDGWQEAHTYDNAGRLWKSQDRAGVARILTYDLQGNVTAEYKSDEINLMLSGSTQAYIEAEASDPSRKRVQKTQNQYDDLGRVVRQSLPGYFIDANLNGVFETTEWRVPQLNQDFDRWGNITKSTNAAGAFEQFDYDSRNNLIRQRGVAVTAYGEHGALVGGAIQAHTLFGYDKVGNRIAQLDSRGYAKATAFNAAGRMLAEYHSDKGESYYYYDEFGRQTYEVDPRLRSTRWDYDNNDQVIAVVGGNGSRVEYEYDALGQRIIQRTRLYSADNPVYAVQRQVFDGLGRLRRDVNPSGIATSYDYDALGNKTYQGNALADYQTWSYDEYGRVTSHRDMSGATTSYTNYNLLGQARNQSNPSVGQNLAFNYDHAGRLRQITDSQSRYGGLPRSTTYDYNIRGLTTREVDKTGTTTVRDLQTRYDAAGRLLSIEDYRGSASSTVELNYYYDIAGNRKLLLFQHRNFSNVVKTGNYWYRYDAMNRLTVSKGGRFIDSSGNYFISFNQNHGARLGYDLAGNRVSEESFEGTTLTKRDYIYDGENRLTSIRRDGIIEHDRSYDNAGRVIQTRDYTDGVARVLNYNEYYLDGRVRFRRTAKSEASNPDLFFFQQKIRFDYADSYDAAGNLRKYTLENFEGQYYVNTYTYSYLKRDQYLQSNESGQSTYFQSGSTRQDYDANGNVYAVDDSRNSANDRTFTINARGETIQKFQTNNGAYYFYANGQQVAWFDQAGKSDFDFNYRAISDQYPTETPSSYVVLEGDTLQTVSLAVYGDASLWYLIADANGLAGSEALAAGLRLTIPNRVSNFRNTSETFKPYSPGDIIGDTTPTLPAPPPPKKKCGTFLQIVVIAVAVVATALTAGAATAVLGPAAATVGGSLAAAGATVAAAAVGAAAGSVASQFAAIGLGLQEDFSFSEVGRAAVSGGLTAGVGTIPGVSSWSTWARTTLSTSLSQGVNVALGYQDRFSWTGVAAAAITSKVFGNTGDLTDTATPLASGLGIAQDFGRFFAAGTLNRTISVALEGRGKIELTEVAADAFGNALGNSIVGKIKQSTTDQQKRVADLRVAMVEEEAARSGDFGRMEASNDAGGSVRPSPVSISQAEYDELVNSGRLGTPGYSVAKLEQIGIRSAAGAGGGIQTFAYRDPAEGLGTPAPIPPSVTPRSDPGVGAFARNSLYALGGLQAFGDLELSILGGIKTLGGTLIPGSMGDSSRMALGDGIDSFVGWARSDHPLDAVFAGVEGRLSAASMLSNSNDPWDLIEAGRLNGSVGIDAALLVDGGLGVGRGVYSAGRAGVGVYREVQALDGPYSFSLAEAGSSTRASLSYDISQWGTYGLPSDGFFVRSLTPMQYTAWRNGLDVDFGGAPIGSYSPLNSAGRYVGFDDTGYPGGMGFVGSAEQLRGVTTQAGYRQATQLNYSPQYLVEFQLRNPTGLQNALYAPYELFERGGLTRGTNFSEFNYPGLRSTDTLNARFRELTGP